MTNIPVAYQAVWVRHDRYSRSLTSGDLVKHEEVGILQIALLGMLPHRIGVLHVPSLKAK
jgi:hypothetical protein